MSRNQQTQPDPLMAGFLMSGGKTMDTTQVERRRMVTVPQEEFAAMLEQAAEKGALHALHEVGLDGEDAARDIRALRNLLDAWREARLTAWRTVVKAITTGLLLALVTGAAIKFKLFGGGQ